MKAKVTKEWAEEQLRHWTFRGQCYDQGSHGTQRCAGCNCKPRQLFTLKDRFGKPVYIGKCEFELFKDLNPKLYGDLLAAQRWLGTQTAATAEDKALSESMSKRREAQRQWREAKRKALAKIKALEKVAAIAVPSLDDEEELTVWYARTAAKINEKL